VRLRATSGAEGIQEASSGVIASRLLAKLIGRVSTNELASSWERGQHEPQLVGLNNDSGGCFSRQQLLEIRSRFCQTNP
jgi:hypothetical protein